jgi:protein TonB
MPPKLRETSPPEKEVRQKTDENLPRKSARKSSTNSAASGDNDLVVYEKGKVIFRLKPSPPQREAATTNPTRDSVVMAASTTKLAAASTSDRTPKVATARPSATPSLWLSPDQAEPLLQNRVEPQYPPEALAGHRAGKVVLEVEVGADGSVSNIRTLSGDPVLAAASAAAVRNWHYQPYRLHDHPSPFQTDVTLTFTPPN